jgi:LPXTG-motif cell wall-anchored protein
VKRATLSRRLLAGAATLALGVGGALALAAPAQATGTSSAVFKDNCDGVFVTINSGQFLDPYEWTITRNDEEVFAGELGKGESQTIFVPAEEGDLIEAGFASSPGGWPKKHYHDKPRLCKDITEPEGTPPTCDEDGKITIPEAPKRVQNPFQYQINGEPVERGSTHDVGPGTYEVTVHWDGKLLKTFVFEFPEPRGCPTTPPDDEGEGGGELPETGTPVMLVAGGALVLLTLGGIMFVMARRRRISFTA